MLLENNYRPKNVSKEHYELCQIAKYILKTKGCKIIGEEIAVHHGKYLDNFKQFNKNKHSKNMIDVVGLDLKGTFYSYYNWHYDKVSETIITDSELTHNEPKFKSIGIEAKISLSDFKNGFCTTCEKTYIIAPKNIIPIDLIPPKIGLIEVDLDNYKIKSIESGMSFNYAFEGITETVKAKTNLDPKFKLRDKPIENKEYQNFCKDIMRYIAYRYTMDNLYKKNEIPMGGDCDTLLQLQM